MKSAMLVLVTLAACATQPPQEYRKDGATPFDRDSDAAACSAQAAAARVPIFSELAIFDFCMRGKGWRMVSVSTPTK